MPLLKKLFALSGVAVLSYSLATLPRIYAVEKISPPTNSLLYNNNYNPGLMAPLPKSSSGSSSQQQVQQQQPTNVSNNNNNNDYYANTKINSTTDCYEIRVGTSSLSDELHKPANTSDAFAAPDLLNLYARAFFKSPAFRLERFALYPDLTDEKIDSLEFRKGDVLFGDLKVLERSENEMLLEWKTNKYSINLAGTAYLG